MRGLRGFFAIFSVWGVVSLSTHAVAEGAKGPDAEAQRLSKAGQMVKNNIVPEGRADRFGHAEVLVHAPIAKVRKQVQNFSKYTEFNTGKFKQSRIVARDKGNTDLYVQVSVLRGHLSLWTVTRFSPAKVVAPGTELIEGKFVKGNVKDVEVRWTLRQVDPEWTVVKCDLLIKPEFEAPRELLDEELRDAAGDAVGGVHEKAQGSRKVEAYGG